MKLFCFFFLMVLSFISFGQSKWNSDCIIVEALPPFSLKLSPFNFLDNFSGGNIDISVEYRVKKLSLSIAGAYFYKIGRFNHLNGFRLKTEARLWSIFPKLDPNHFLGIEYLFKEQSYNIHAFILETNTNGHYSKDIDVFKTIHGFNIKIGYIEYLKKRCFIEVAIGGGLRHKFIRNEGLLNPDDKVGTGFDDSHDSNPFTDRAFYGFYPSIVLDFKLGMLLGKWR